MKTVHKSFFFLTLAASILLASSTASAQGFKWWQSEVQKELGLSTEQIARLDGIFKTAEPTLRAQKSALDRLEHKLSKVIADSASDEAMVLQAAELVEGARAELSRTRTLQLFRMRRVLTDEQNTKMKEMHAHDRRERERRNKPKGDPDGQLYSH